MLDLGRRYGGLAYTCERSFEATGAWVTDTPEPAWQIRFADHCHRLAFHADRLRWLVPEVAGLTAEDQVQPLAGLAPLDASLAGRTGRAEALAVLWEALAGQYASVLAEANPVSDGAAIRWLHLLESDARSALAALALPV